MIASTSSIALYGGVNELMSHEVLDSGLKARLFSRERVERSERGDTMIEVLLALMVLGLTSVALIVAFSTTLSASARSIEP